MSKIKEVLVLHHSHLDVGYTHPQPIILELQKRYIDQALDLCERTEDWPTNSRFRWTCEASFVVLKWLEEASEQQITRFSRYLHNGQLSVSTSLMHITPLCSAEEAVRTLYPVRQLRERFGLDFKTAIHHDVNGQPWSYGQLLLDAGVEFFIMGINIHFGGIPLTRPLAFHWRVPDGRSLLTFNGEHYSLFCQICHPASQDTAVVAAGLEKYLQKIEAMPDYPFDFIYLTATNPPLYDNNPPDPELAPLLRRWNEEGRAQTISLVTPEQLYARVKAQAHRLATHAGDWTDYWNFGAASSALETALSRRTKQGMKVVELLDAFQPERDRRFLTVKEQAWEQIHLYDEHTWGAYNSVGEPDSINAKVQWMHKAHTAYAAHSLTSYLYATKLEQLSKNPLQSEQPEGVLLINPSPFPITHDLHIPASFTWKGRHLAAQRMGQDVLHCEPRTQDGPSCGLVDLPPFSWRKIPLAMLQAAAPSPDIVVSEGRIETPFHICTFDPLTGRITGLYDKKLDWQVLDVTGPWTLFQYVREIIDPLFHVQERRAIFPRDIEKGNNSISVWNHDWHAQRRSYTRMLDCRVERREHSVALIMQWEAPGVDALEQRFTFFSYRPDVEMTALLHKQAIRSPEGIYFALPLNLQAWRCHFDSATRWVELDREQLPGVCRDWVTVDRCVCVYDEQRGVTLACPDAPLVQVGNFNFGKEQKAIPRNPRPLLLAWPMNNYWDTNFRAEQPGMVSFTYSLSTFQRFVPAQSQAAGIRAADAVVVAPVINCERPETGQWLRVEGAEATVFDVKPAADGHGILLRLHNSAHASTDVNISFPAALVQQVWRTDALEENREELPVAPDGALHLRLSACQMLHLRVVLA
jgi:alpha-mannosidase